MMKLKPGDKVVILESIVKWNCYNSNLSKWIGKIMTIRTTYNTKEYCMIEDHDENSHMGWVWHEDYLRPLNTRPNIVNIMEVD